MKPYIPESVGFVCSNCGEALTKCVCCADDRAEEIKKNILREDIRNLTTKLLDALVSKNNETPEVRKRVKNIKNLLNQKVVIAELMKRSKLIIDELSGVGN